MEKIDFGSSIFALVMFRSIGLFQTIQSFTGKLFWALFVFPMLCIIKAKDPSQTGIAYELDFARKVHEFVWDYL
ncbi:MAG: hypothetical protein J7501_17815, partial [Bdellovibrio sp.]|nr:hypothetical protein [Bdellovibrio sp.]